MSDPTLLPAPRQAVMLDDRIRGVPPGTDGLDGNTIAALAWHPADGRMSLPVLTLDEAAFVANRDLFLRYAREQGVVVAPHGKTPMAPDLARSLVEAGAWGTTVADIRQASVMLKAGLDRLILANGVGGASGASRLAALVGTWPKADIHVFVDSVAAAAALGDAWQAQADLPALKVLIETGQARGGARTLAEADAIIDAVLQAKGRLILAGAATYEGASGQSTPEQSAIVIGALLDLTGDVFRHVRARVGPQVPLVLTAGGSGFFDRVVAVLGPVVTQDGVATLVLRSGALFFHDHGSYERAMRTLDDRKGFALAGKPVMAGQALRPALRLWAEVLSRPEPRLAVCGMGMRDVSFDQDLPIVLAVFRNGRPLAPTPQARVTRLNDQHTYMELGPDSALAVGDVVEFGISHPCTCLDRYRVIFGVDEAGVVQHAFPTYFG